MSTVSAYFQPRLDSKNHYRSRFNPLKLVVAPPPMSVLLAPVGLSSHGRRCCSRAEVVRKPRSAAATGRCCCRAREGVIVALLPRGGGSACAGGGAAYRCTRGPAHSAAADVGVDDPCCLVDELVDEELKIRRIVGLSMFLTHTPASTWMI